MNKFKRSILLVIAVLTLAIGTFALTARPAEAALFSSAKEAACGGVDLSGNPKPCDASGNNINTILTTVINVVSFIVGVIAVIMLIIGGFKFVTSGGDSNNVASARNTILYAVIGLVVVAIAQFIVKFVLVKVYKLGN